MERNHVNYQNMSSEEKFKTIGRLSYDLFMATGGRDLDLHRLSVAGRMSARDARLENDSSNQK